MRKTGYYEKLGNIEYFIPDPLPPKNPPLHLDLETTDLYGQAMLQIGKLNEMAHLIPDANRFIKAYVIKEALLSSAIEGIHTTLLDVYTQPLVESKPSKNTQLVINYIKALDVALAMIRNESMPVVTRVILSAHKTLMMLSDSNNADPGHYRKQSVKVGNLTPPPAPKIPELMANLEHYINTDDTMPYLVKAGLAHVQFETIHPFLDGNGRIGRLLIVLMLINDKILSEPILYPSYYFKKHRLAYYHHLDRVRTHGDFEGWIKFYLTALRDSSIDAYQRAKNIETLREECLHTLYHKQQLSKTDDTVSRALSILFNYPIISITELSTQLDVSYNTAHQIIVHFINLEILVPHNMQKRGKLFRFKKYWDILEHD